MTIQARRPMLLLVCLIGCKPAPDDTDEGEPFVPVPVGDPATATIGAAGGSIATDDGVLTLAVPLGALTADTAISLQAIEWEDGYGWLLEPDGTVFAVPVTATVSVPESTVGSIGQTVGIDRVERLEMAGAAVSHFSLDAPLEVPGPTFASTWRPDDALVDVAIALDHLSVLGITWGEGQRKRWTRLGRFEVGETFGAEVYYTTEPASGSLRYWDGQTWRYESSPIVRTITGVEFVAGTVALVPVGDSVPAQQTGWAGFRHDFTCQSAGRTGVIMRQSILRETPAHREMDEFVEEQVMDVDCLAPPTASCLASDPVDLGLSSDGDPSLDLLCGTTGIDTSGRPWVQSIFDGVWLPAPWWSWFSSTTFGGASGAIGTVTVEHHDGEFRAFSDDLPPGDWAVAYTDFGYVASLAPSYAASVTSASVVSGIKKSETAPFLQDGLGTFAFDATVADP